MPVGYGPVAALSGTLSGILLSGEAFSNAFTRTSIATLELAPQDADEDGNVGGEKFGDTPLIASRLKPWRDKKY